MSKKIINKGTGAGGCKTIDNGFKFENKTDNCNYLKVKGFTAYKFNKIETILSKTFEDKKIYFLKQGKLKKYVLDKYNIDLYRNPDEAYIIEYKSGKIAIKILEKKNQNVEGSIVDKLWAGPVYKREYEIEFGEKFQVSYAFCVSSFLENKLKSNEKKNRKFQTLNIIFEESNIQVLFGDSKNYFESLYTWINL